MLSTEPIEAWEAVKELTVTWVDCQELVVAGDALVAALEAAQAEQRKLREMFEGVAELADAHFVIPNEVTPGDRLRQVAAEIRDTLADTYAPEPTGTERDAVAEVERLRMTLAEIEVAARLGRGRP